jgi:hypothetical protein
MVKRYGLIGLYYALIQMLCYQWHKLHLPQWYNLWKLNVNVNIEPFLSQFIWVLWIWFHLGTFNEFWWFLYLYAFVTSQNHESLLNFLPLSNSKAMNLDGFHFFCAFVRFQKDEVQWYFYLSTFIRFHNHELNYDFFISCFC